MTNALQGLGSLRGGREPLLLGHHAADEPLLLPYYTRKVLMCQAACALFS